MKRFVIVFLIATMTFTFASLSFSAVPEAVVKVIGVSDRTVAKDTMDIYTRPSTGLANVGVGEVVYVKGVEADLEAEEPLTAWVWELTARPNGSNAALSAIDVQVVKFTPDVLGTYRVSLRVSNAEGQSEAVEYPINASTYVGVQNADGSDAAKQCVRCHSADGGQDTKFDEWKETNHAMIYQRMISRQHPAYAGNYRATCAKCHTVGWDPLAANGGFDDAAAQEEFAFPDSAHMNDTTWNWMIERYPNTAKMANIQCESCHGPGFNHNGNNDDNRIAVSWDDGVCAKCHDSGSHHYRPMQWESTGHANPPVEERSACSGCHSGKGFVDRLNGLPAEERDSTYVPITCVACHDPHNATNNFQLRTVAPVVLMDTTEVNIGNGNTCAMCHQSRRYAPTYILSRITNPARFNPHGSPQTDMLVGTNAAEFGQQMESSPHARVVENGCVGCHMAPTPDSTHNQPNGLKMGDHTFAMKTEDGVEHVGACAECHGEVESFEDIMADSDWDGDSEVEGAMAEIAGLMDQLARALPPIGEPSVVPANWFTAEQRGAAYNYFFIQNDGSKGMHNAKYAKSLLQASLQRNLGVEPVEGVIPGSYSLSEAYPNPFNPISAFTYSLARDGNVDIKVFDMAGREVAIVVSGEYKVGNYRAAVNLHNQPSGVYILRMQAGAFDASRKLILVK